MKRLAIYNFGMFREAAGSPSNQGFRDREGPNLAAVERAHGFIGRAGYAGEPERLSWGQQRFPRFYVGNGEEGAPSTLSLWKDLESLFAFTYSGIHVEAVKRAQDWFVEKRWPAYVLWWVEAPRLPDWREAVARFELLHDHGPSPDAFNFKTPFDPEGRTTAIDKAAAKRIAGANARPA
jgi:uncharacterized protein DUF3291